MIHIECVNNQTPSRGWYNIFPFRLSESVDYSELRWSLKAEESLVLARVNIGEYKDGPIAQEGIDNLCAMLRFFKQYNKELILRFVYDDEGRGMINEPSDSDIIIGHMRQVGPCIAQYSDIIYTTQGLFFGSWGEMHTSRYTDKVNVALLAIAFFESTKGKVRMALRTPEYVRTLKSMLEGIQYPHTDRLMSLVGIYDDAMLSSPTDMGTFSESSLEEDKAYVIELARKNPLGGEVIQPNELNTATAAVSALSGLGVSYLNSQYDERVLSQWRTACYGKSGMTVYDYITKHMGYRLELTRVKSNILTGRHKLTIANTGMAPLYDEVKLLINGCDYGWHYKQISPNSELEIIIEKDQLKSRLTLEIVRIKDGASIGLYNELT